MKPTDEKNPSEGGRAARTEPLVAGEPLRGRKSGLIRLNGFVNIGSTSTLLKAELDAQAVSSKPPSAPAKLLGLLPKKMLFCTESLPLLAWA